MLVKYKKYMAMFPIMLALILLAQPAWSKEGSRGRGGRERDGSPRMQSAGRVESTGRAERHSYGRMEKNVSNQPTIPEPRHWLGYENRQNSDRSAGREFNFSKPDMRVERNNTRIQENRNVHNERFNDSTPAQTEQRTFENIRAKHDFTGNRISTRTPPAADRSTNQSFTKTITTPDAQTTRTITTPDAQMTSATGHQFRRQDRNENIFAKTDRGDRSQWRADSRRDNDNIRIVDSIRSQRTAESRGDRHFGDDRRSGDRHFGDRDRDRRGDHSIFATRNDFIFFDRHHFRHHQIVSPDFFFFLDFSFGPWRSFYPVYPYYHRGYLFVNPCGYWPYDYDYMRYYWYGCSPYNWYGYNPVPYQSGSSDTYNYYTYNYYNSSTGQPTAGSYDNQPVDQTALTNAQQQAKPPAPATSADNYFDEGVKAFGDGDYNTAAQKFALAKQLAPEDKVLTFAYSQTLFAAGNYTQAAESLREALAKVNPETEGVFYPRGLYSTDDDLIKQIDTLSTSANQNLQDANLQLLLGYHQLGIGELDKAAAPLHQAAADQTNAPAANSLIKLLDKLQAAQTETPKK